MWNILNANENEENITLLYFGKFYFVIKKKGEREREAEMHWDTNPKSIYQPMHKGFTGGLIYVHNLLFLTLSLIHRWLV